jgi:hypothetical protein
MAELVWFDSLAGRRQFRAHWLLVVIMRLAFGLRFFQLPGSYVTIDGDPDVAAIAPGNWLRVTWTWSDPNTGQRLNVVNDGDSVVVWPNTP